QFVRALNSDAAPTCATASLTADVSGVLPVANGGTGAVSFTAGAVLFGNGTSALAVDSSNFYWDNTNKRLSLGSTSPANGPLWLQRDAAVVDVFGRAASSSAAFHSVRFVASRARGSNASPSAMSNGDFIFQFSGGGHDGSSFDDFAARFNFLADGNWSTSSHPTRIEFSTTPVGSTSPSIRMVFPSDGGVKLNTASKPTCNSTRRGTFFYVAGGAGVKDTVEVCAKDAADAYAWRTIY
ncbi:MAG TPA: hypothetical protein VGA40_10640, partial [Candidatus Acidoferrales bacterium]